jgi:hypothetical protein
MTKQIREALIASAGFLAFAVALFALSRMPDAENWELKIIPGVGVDVIFLIAAVGFAVVGLAGLVVYGIRWSRQRDEGPAAG